MERATALGEDFIIIGTAVDGFAIRGTASPCNLVAQ